MPAASTWHAGREPHSVPSTDGGADDGGTGFGPTTRPCEPTGGIAVDWEKFEADFGVYAEEHEPGAVGSRSSR